MSSASRNCTGISHTASVIGLILTCLIIFFLVAQQRKIIQIPLPHYETLIRKFGADCRSERMQPDHDWSFTPLFV